MLGRAAATPAPARIACHASRLGPPPSLALPLLPPPLLQASPYRYGHIVETRVPASGAPTVEKHYTLGRASWELA